MSNVWLRAHFPPKNFVIWWKISIFVTKKLIPRYSTTFQLPNHLDLQKLNKIQLYNAMPIHNQHISKKGLPFGLLCLMCVRICCILEKLTTLEKNLHSCQEWREGLISPLVGSQQCLGQFRNQHYYCSEDWYTRIISGRCNGWMDPCVFSAPRRTPNSKGQPSDHDSISG